MKKSKIDSKREADPKGKPIAQQLRGIAKSALSNKTDQEIKAMMFEDKHGIWIFS